MNDIFPFPKGVWAEFPGTNGNYYASVLGEVFSRPRKAKVGNVNFRQLPGLILKGSPCRRTETNSYLIYGIVVNGKRKNISGHQLVWISFFGPIPKGLEINHKNGVKGDNRLENLEVVTRSENVKHAFRTGLKQPNRGSKSGTAKINEKQCEEIRKLYKEGWTYKELRTKFKFKDVGSVVTGHSWQHMPNASSPLKRGVLGDRQCRGSRVNTAKLTDQDVIDIRRKYDAGVYSIEDISLQYAITSVSVRNIGKRKTWKWLQ